MNKNQDTINLLKTAREHIDEIIMMISDNRYYIDISKRIVATQDILNKVNTNLIDNRLRRYVKETLPKIQVEDKTDEIINILRKYNE